MTPTFFCISDKSNSLSVLSKNIRKIYRLENFRRTSLSEHCAFFMFGMPPKTTLKEVRFAGYQFLSSILWDQINSKAPWRLTDHSLHGYKFPLTLQPDFPFIAVPKIYEKKAVVSQTFTPSLPSRPSRPSFPWIKRKKSINLLAVLFVFRKVLIQLLEFDSSLPRLCIMNLILLAAFCKQHASEKCKKPFDLVEEREECLAKLKMYLPTI